MKEVSRTLHQKGIFPTIAHEEWVASWIGTDSLDVAMKGYHIWKRAVSDANANAFYTRHPICCHNCEGESAQLALGTDLGLAEASSTMVTSVHRMFDKKVHSLWYMEDVS